MRKNSDNKLKRPLRIKLLFCRSADIFLGDIVKLFLTLLLPVFTARVVSYVCEGEVGETFEDTKFVLFIIVAASVYVGMFNSLTLICKEREIVKREYFSFLNLKGYIIANFLFQLIIVAFQAAIFTYIYQYYLHLCSNQLEVKLAFVTLLLIMASSDALGLLISATAPAPELANLAAPLVIVVELVFSGVLFSLNGVKKYISYAMASRWGMNALGSAIDILSLKKRIETYKNGSITEHFPDLAEHKSYDISAYDSSLMHILFTWMAMVAITILLLVLCFLILGRVKNDKRV